MWILSYNSYSSTVKRALLVYVGFYKLSDPAGKPGPKALCFGLLDLKFQCSSSSPPPHLPHWGPCLFWPLWLFPLQAPLTSVCRNLCLASSPVMVMERLLGSHIQPVWQVPPLNKELGGFSPYSTTTLAPASQVWRGRVLVDASLTKGRHFAAFTDTQLLLTASPSPQSHFSKVISLCPHTQEP